jgi:hypothetical protein
MGICLNNYPTHKGTIYLFSHIHTQNRNKKTIKIKNPKNSIEKNKRREKENWQEKSEINNI